MDSFQAALDGLVKESKEQITQVQDAAASAVLAAHVVPHRLAVVIAQRFTRERVDTAFPVLCLLDAILVRTQAAAKAQATFPADHALAAVLGEFWPMAETAFESIYDYGTTQPPAWREKCLRTVKRWKQRKLLKEEVVDRLVRAMEHGRVEQKDSMSADHSVDNSNNNNINSSNPQGTPSPTASANDATTGGDKSPAPSGTSADAFTASTARARPSAPAAAAVAFTAAQAQSFSATLQACMSALESLPSARRTLYLELIHAQHFRTPTKAALAFYEELLGELRREVTNTSGGASPRNGGNGNANATAGGDSSRSANKHPEKGDVQDEASAGHAREALGKLLDQLHTGNPDDGLPGGHRPGGAGGGGGSVSAAAHTTVVRYNSFIFSDIYAKQPLSQRGHGFGILQRRAEHGGSGGGGHHGSSGGGGGGHGNASGGGGNHNSSSSNSFYTSYFPKPVAKAQRPFRIPATQQMHGGAVRLWFPTPQEWVRATDMADLAQYASKNAPERKRAREEA